MYIEKTSLQGHPKQTNVDKAQCEGKKWHHMNTPKIVSFIIISMIGPWYETTENFDEKPIVNRWYEKSYDIADLDV